MPEASRPCAGVAEACPFQSPVHRSNEASQGVEHDIKLLVEGIKRLGVEKDGQVSTTFGQIFKDEVLEQQLESLVGSLKAAKKRGILTFEGQMLLQGGALFLGARWCHACDAAAWPP